MLRAAAVAGCALPALAGLGATDPAAAAGCAPVTPPAPAEAPAPGRACLVEVSPYPFGDDGGPVVDPGARRCLTTNLPCHLEVTSLAFRAWNRGLAAVRRASGATPFGVWLWNGRNWLPDSTFPGTGTCQGDTVLWAGKLDYWLIGTGALNWPRLCRFDGTSFQWQPLSVPSATLARVTTGTTPTGQPIRLPGGVTSGACQAWNDCWFFGSHGTIVRWDGATLSDASPDPGQAWRWTGYQAAVARRDAAGNPLGFAVGLTAWRAGAWPAGDPQLLPSQPDGTPPPQLVASDGGPFAPLAFAPPTVPSPNDPYRTDLVAVDADAAGRAWVAGVPRIVDATLQPAPIVATTRAGADPGCPGPAPERFPGAGAGAIYRWKSIAAVPNAGAALAGGSYRAPGAQPQEAEPVLVRVTCAGDVGETRFLVTVPGDPGHGTVPAQSPPIPSVAASAVNDAWVSIPRGSLQVGAESVETPPRLLRLTDGQPPLAPDGDDREDRPVILREDPQPPAEVPPGVPSPVVGPKPRLPAFYGFRSRFSGRTLRLTFKVRRRGMLGIEALRGKRTVATTGLRRFRPPRGMLTLKFSPRLWPTRVRIITDTPVGAMVQPPRVLGGSVHLAARARAIRGRRVATVRFDYAPAGTGDWREIATSYGEAPYVTSFLTTQLPDGAYDFRVVVTDTAREEGTSAVVRRPVRNGASG
jgi:hypothetical protein